MKRRTGKGIEEKELERRKGIEIGEKNRKGI